MLVAVPLNGGCSPPAVTDVAQWKQWSCRRVQPPSKGPPMIWKKSPVFLWSPGKRGRLGVPEFQFLSRQERLDSPHWLEQLPVGCSNFISATVGLNGHEQKMTPWRKDGGCKDKEQCPPGFNGWPISRVSPMEIKITAPPGLNR